MSIGLHNLSPFSGSKKKKMRVGRGHARKGITAGRGQKGQKARSGVGGLKRLGMKKLILSTPKVRGFKSYKPNAAVVNVSALEAAFEANAFVTPKTLKEAGLIPASAPNHVKILGDGEISKALRVKGCSVSKSAAEKITSAGGEIIA